MPIVNVEGWKKCEQVNKDAYGKCCVDIAREVMRLLDDGAQIDTPKAAGDLISTAEKNIGAAGITGFMAGAIANMVSHLHSRGGEFRVMWNKYFGVDDGEGVVNPAILMIQPRTKL